MTAKFYITAFLYVCATALFIAAAPTSVLKYETPTRLIEFGYFEQCTTVATIKTCEKTTNNCEKFMDVIKTGQAFVIISCVVIGLVAVGTIIRIANPIICIPLNLVFIIGGLLAIASGLITWGCAFGVYDSEFCGRTYKVDPAIKIGASGPLAFVGWCLVILAWFAEIIMSSIPDVPAPAVESAPDAVKE